jgi:hypothetical protein
MGRTFLQSGTLRIESAGPQWTAPAPRSEFENSRPYRESAPPRPRDRSRPAGIPARSACKGPPRVAGRCHFGTLRRPAERWLSWLKARPC